MTGRNDAGEDYPRTNDTPAYAVVRRLNATAAPGYANGAPTLARRARYTAAATAYRLSRRASATGVHVNPTANVS